MNRPAVVIAVVASGLSGCDEVFDLVEIPVPDPICLEENFDDGVIDVGSWTTTGAEVNVAVRVDAGHGAIDVPEATTSSQDPYGGIVSSKRDLTGHAIQVEILTVAAPASRSDVVLQLRHDSTNLYSFLVQRGMLLTRKRVDGDDTMDAVAYDPAQHRFVRMRHDESTNELLFETRAITGPWTEMTRTTATVPLTQSKVEVLAGSFDIAGAFTAEIDNIQLSGDCTF